MRPRRPSDWPLLFFLLVAVGIIGSALWYVLKLYPVGTPRPEEVAPTVAPSPVATARRHHRHHAAASAPAASPKETPSEPSSASPAPRRTVVMSASGDDETPTVRSAAPEHRPPSVAYAPPESRRPPTHEPPPAEGDVEPPNRHRGGQGPLHGIEGGRLPDAGGPERRPSGGSSGTIAVVAHTAIEGKFAIITIVVLNDGTSPIRMSTGGSFSFVNRNGKPVRGVYYDPGWDPLSDPDFASGGSTTGTLKPGEADAYYPSFPVTDISDSASGIDPGSSGPIEGTLQVHAGHQTFNLKPEEQTTNMGPFHSLPASTQAKLEEAMHRLESTRSLVWWGR